MDYWKSEYWELGYWKSEYWLGSGVYVPGDYFESQRQTFKDGRKTALRPGRSDSIADSRNENQIKERIF